MSLEQHLARPSIGSTFNGLITFKAVGNAPMIFVSLLSQNKTSTGGYWSTTRPSSSAVVTILYVLTSGSQSKKSVSPFSKVFADGMSALYAYGYFRLQSGYMFVQI